MRDRFALRLGSGRTDTPGEAGVTLIELLAALAVFALLFLMVDSVFFATNRSSKKTELAADVQQNARIAVERLIREVRESAPSVVAIGGDDGEMAVVFKSARLGRDNSVFCLWVRNATDPSSMYDSHCFDDFLTDVPAPPYEGLLSDICDLLTQPCGTYTPLWQRYVGYYVQTAADGTKELRRAVAQLDAWDEDLPDPTTLSGGDVIASYIESFDVSQSGSVITISLKARGEAVVQGSAVPAQEILLDGQVVVRN